MGYDFFKYQLTDNNTGEADTGNVTVLVKQAGEEQECYSRDVMECLGEELVTEALAGRGIETGPDDDIFQVLLESLRKSGGFTMEELEGGVLESAERKRTLLNCLGIEIPGDSGNEELRQLILDYQEENCNGSGSGPCYTLEILQCWGRKDVINILSLRQIPIGNNPFQQLLNSLRSTGGFTAQEIDFMLETGVLDNLLNCMGFDVGENTPPDQMREIIFAYQADNCSGNQLENRSPGVNLDVLSRRDVINLLRARNVEVEDTSDRTEMENALNNSAGGNRFTRTEMELLTRNSLTSILETKGLTFTRRENKASLINKLIT
jgi:hypothetical protein